MTVHGRVRAVRAPAARLALAATLSLALAACSGTTTTATDPAGESSAVTDAAVGDGHDGATGRDDHGRPQRGQAPSGQGQEGQAQKGQDTGGVRPEGSGGKVLVADPEHAVDPPGPRRRDEAIAPPDMLLYNAEEPLSDDVVASIGALRGVEEVSRMSMAQVSLENRVYSVAAVDSASYRLFTDPASAMFQEQWDRVAGGEVAVAPASRKIAPINDEGYLELAIGDASEEIHVGAFAPQVEGIDAVVNTSWGDELEIPAGNALLLRTGQKSPQALRPAIARIVGDSATIQDMDVVAREGLDPEAVQQAFLVGDVGDAVGTFRYTVIGGGRIAPDPAWTASHIVTEEVPLLGSVTCNRYIMPQLRAALTEIATSGLGDEIHPGEYAGCYYPRFIAGTTSLSNHSFGTALDLNTPGNQRGTVGEMDRTVVAIFKKWGFAWGGDWGYTDPMHFEADRLVDPR